MALELEIFNLFLFFLDFCIYFDAWIGVRQNTISTTAPSLPNIYWHNKYWTKNWIKYFVPPNSSVNKFYFFGICFYEKRVQGYFGYFRINNQTNPHKFYSFRKIFPKFYEVHSSLFHKIPISLRKIRQNCTKKRNKEMLEWYLKPGVKHLDHLGQVFLRMPSNDWKILA